MYVKGGKGGREPRDLVHDLGRMPVRHRVAEGVGQHHGDFPILEAAAGRHDLADARHAPLGIRECAVLLEERRSGQEDVRVLGRFVQEQILDDDSLHRREGGGDVLGIGIGLGRVLALDVHAHEAAVEGGFEHVRNPQARLAQERDAPRVFEQRADAVVRDVAVTTRRERPMSHEPWTLFWPRNGRRLGGHRQVHMTIVDPWLCSVTPSPEMAPLPGGLRESPKWLSPPENSALRRRTLSRRYAAGLAALDDVCVAVRPSVTTRRQRVEHGDVGARSRRQVASIWRARQ
jgi:hypothetical protein